jgi:hypothetical protein
VKACCYKIKRDFSALVIIAYTALAAHPTYLRRRISERRWATGNAVESHAGHMPDPIGPLGPQVCYRKYRMTGMKEYLVSTGPFDLSIDVMNFFLVANASS